MVSIVFCTWHWKNFHYTMLAFSFLRVPLRYGMLGQLLHIFNAMHVITMLVCILSTHSSLVTRIFQSQLKSLQSKLKSIYIFLATIIIQLQCRANSFTSKIIIFCYIEDKINRDFLFPNVILISENFIVRTMRVYIYFSLNIWLFDW